MFIFEMNFYLFSYFGNKSQAIWFRTLNIENNLSWLSWIKLAKPVALLIFQQDFKIGENKSGLGCEEWKQVWECYTFEWFEIQWSSQ